MNWQNFIYRIESSYYTELLMMIIAIVVATYSIRSFRLNKNRIYILILSIASLTETLIISMDFIAGKKKSVWHNTNNITLALYLITEIYCFTMILTKSICNKKIAVIMKVITIIYSLSLLIYSLTPKLTSNTINMFVVTEGLIIIIYSLFYFGELFKYPPNKKLISDSTFWLISGFLIVMSFISPFFVVENYINTNLKFIWHEAYLINNTGYILLFSTILIGMIWEQKSIKFSFSSL